MSEPLRRCDDCAHCGPAIGEDIRCDHPDDADYPEDMREVHPTVPDSDSVSIEPWPEFAELQSGLDSAQRGMRVEMDRLRQWIGRMEGAVRRVHRAQKNKHTFRPMKSMVSSSSEK